MSTFLLFWEIFCFMIIFSHLSFWQAIYSFLQLFVPWLVLLLFHYFIALFVCLFWPFIYLFILYIIFFIQSSINVLFNLFIHLFIHLLFDFSIYSNSYLHSSHHSFYSHVEYLAQDRPRSGKIVKELILAWKFLSMILLRSCHDFSKILVISCSWVIFHLLGLA